MSRRLLATVVCGLMAIGGVAIQTEKPAAAYSDVWTKSDAYWYADGGLWERYVLGGGTFIDNNYWDSNEGIDCSGYVDKVFALEDWTWPTDYYHPYSTWDWAAGVPHSQWADRWVVTSPDAFMTTFVYNYDPSNLHHMGIIQGVVADGSFTTLEALGAASGVVPNTRWLSDLLNLGYVRVTRENWTG